VIAGMQWVDAIPRGEPPPSPARVLQASIGADRKPPPAFPVAPSAESQLLEAEAAKLGLPPSPPKAPPPPPK
jgi:peptidylprolyl isomerase